MMSMPLEFPRCEHLGRNNISSLLSRSECETPPRSLAHILVRRRHPTVTKCPLFRPRHGTLTRLQAEVSCIEQRGVRQ
jgi:hypothetical protein